tara:strand:- start:267 stop:503 length:237 start_codon:yes stop_codon:yes gene_type:complete
MNRSKNKTFKNIKDCKKFIDVLTIRVKRRFKQYSLYFKINDNNINYWLILKPQATKLINANYIYNQKMWKNSRFIDLY